MAVHFTDWARISAGMRTRKRGWSVGGGGKHVFQSTDWEILPTRKTLKLKNRQEVVSITAHSSWIFQRLRFFAHWRSLFYGMDRGFVISGLWSSLIWPEYGSEARFWRKLRIFRHSIHISEKKTVQQPRSEDNFPQFLQILCGYLGALPASFPANTTGSLHYS